MPSAVPTRSRSTLLAIVVLWLTFYASLALITPPLLDDADSVHAEVAREMLLRHDYITLHANGIRYLEKAPLFYWAMAASMRVFQLFGATGPRALAAAARIPLALSMLALALLCETFARRVFASLRAGLYAALIVLSSFGMYLFTRMLIPDAMVCLWTTLALYALWLTETRNAHQRLPAYLFAFSCALNVLTKGLIGVVFPVAIALIYLLATRGLRGTLQRIRELHPLTSTLLFLIIAAPWHILAGLANPGHGHPAPFVFAHGHWQVPLPTDGNVRGWFWFYFMNEHLLRYLSLRVPHDYDTAPLWLFWGLCLLWLMPWSAFGFKATSWALPFRNAKWRNQLRSLTLSREHRDRLLLILSAAFVLLFFAASSRQEYYVLPALPFLAILIAGWLCSQTTPEESLSSLTEAERSGDAAESPASGSAHTQVPRGFSLGSHNPPEKMRGFSPGGMLSYFRCLYIPLAVGTLILLASLDFLLHTPAPSPNTDLASLLTQNPADYALSLGHFMDLTGPSVALFRAPLLIAACALFFGPLVAILLRKRHQPHPANLALAAGSFGFLISVLWGLTIFSPVLTSAQLAEAIRPQLTGDYAIVIHGEYESASTIGFYLQQPEDFNTDTPGNSPEFGLGPHLWPVHPIFILEGRSSNLWYGSFFPDAPKIFLTPAQLAQFWRGPQRIFLWQSLTDPPNQLPPLPTPVYILVKSGGKEIVSNHPNR